MQCYGRFDNTEWAGLHLVQRAGTYRTINVLVLFVQMILYIVHHTSGDNVAFIGDW